MRIAIYQPRVSYYVGGAEVVAFEHARWFAKLGHKVTVVAVRAPFIKQSEYFREFVKKNRRVHFDFLTVPSSLRWLYEIPAGISWERWNLESLALSTLAIPYFQNKKFDVVGVHNILDIFAIPRSQKTVLHLHGYPKKITPELRTALRNSGKITAVSKYIRKKWQRLAELPLCEVTENGIESGTFRPLPTKKKFDILYVGRLIPIKGVQYLIEAAAKIAKKRRDLRVAIAGRGEFFNHLKKLAARRKLTKNISFLGYVKIGELPKLYNSAKIAVLPSYDREGILTTMLEASACGVPVITTTACSMPEFIKNERNGLLVTPKSGAALERAISKLLKNDELRERLGRGARDSIVKYWDWSKRIKKVASIYEKAIVDS